MSPLRRFALSVALVALLIALGTAGYMFLEGWTIHSALYMTVITLSTVGFGEVLPLSPGGEWFTILFIALGLVVFGFAAASITAFIVQGELHELVRGRRVDRDIDRLTDHYVVCGCGAVGREIVLEFAHADVPFVVVDISLEAAEIPAEHKVLSLEGDATSEEVLERAGVRRARGLIAAMHHDPDNVFVTLTARGLNPNLQIVARANERGNEGKLLRAGADRVISPFEIAGRRMASTVLRPSVVSFLEVVTHSSGEDMLLEQVRVEAASTLVDHSLSDSDLGKVTGCVIVGVNDGAGQPRIAPGFNTNLSGLTIRSGDCLIALGSSAQIARLEALAQGRPAT